jgi:uncharacterized protein YdaU (DUF1376 family)
VTYKWYKRNADDALNGMMALTLEERGAYNTILDLMYQRRGVVPDDARWIAGWLGCSLRKWSSLRAALIVKGKLFAVDINGLPSLANKRVEKECATTRGEHPEAFEPVSAPVQPRNPRENAPAPKENKGLEPLEEDKERDKKQEPTVPCPAKPNAGREDWFAKAWDAYPRQGRERSKSRDKTLPIWREAAKRAGGGERLAAAVQRYVREDKQHKGECGPPGFHRWLNDGKWEHWLPEARAPSASPVAMSPALADQRRALLMGEASA